MTDDLVEWLHEEAGFAIDRAEEEMLRQAADRIEAQAAEIERLTEAYNNLGNKALEQVSKLGIENGRKDVQIDALSADLNQANREIERLREALEFYADDANHKYLPHAGCSCVDADGGETARKALEQST